MENNPGAIQRIIRFACAGLLLAVFISVIIFPSPPEQTASAMNSLDEGDTATPTATLENTPTFTATPTRTPTLISGVLTCNTVATGVTCTNYGTYLKYDININVTGLTGGATASNIFIGTYKRSTNGGWMGMMSNFIHAETSIHQSNKVFSMVRISPFDAAAVDYASFTSGAGTNVYVINSVNHWRYIAGTGNYPNTLSVRGNVDYPITGYSVIGSIYLYSNQAFVTVTPTSSPTLTPTNTVTSTPSPTPTQQDRWYTGNSRGSVYGVKANISAPATAPMLITSGESSYVTTATTHWIQTGWRHYKDNTPNWPYTLPMQYVEINPPAGYIPIVHYGSQNWGEVVEYKITWSSSLQQWCAHINGDFKACEDLGFSPPTYVHAHSEVHVSPQNELSTTFLDVSYLDSNSVWHLFNLELWREDAPYRVNKFYNYEYYNYGP
ncbi:MAG: hypothetical protein QY332_03335 [Anaerolineales bacterium]|nr:MAG: hypothetical protein QY332_03335 [Anaerolineales bacterium]